MIGDIFRPSEIEDEIYNILEDYILGSDLYEYNATNSISDYLGNYEKIPYQMCCSPVSILNGTGICSVAWCENGFPKLVVFEYKET